ncbi:MAG: hypothetical protein R2814_03215 [Flavobacteriaceae bacterium]
MKRPFRGQTPKVVSELKKKEPTISMFVFRPFFRIAQKNVKLNVHLKNKKPAIH